MKLVSLHKAQLKAHIYQLIATSGVLTDNDVFGVLTEVVEELGDSLGGNDA